MLDASETWHLQLPCSYYRRAIVDCILAVGASCAAFAASWRTKLDVGAGVSTLYILMMYCFQSSFLEWPERRLQKPQLFLAASLGNLLLPSLLVSKGLWSSLRCTSWALSATLAVSAYTRLVQGPRYRVPHLHGKVFLVTGANSGIGYEASKAFALAGATVILACRDQRKAHAAMEQLKLCAPAAKLHFLPLDLASMKSVRRFAELLQASGMQVDVLVLNAGVMRSKRELTEDGFEVTMAANHLGHFLLVQLLLPEFLAQERDLRVVVVGSNICYSYDVFDFGELVSVRDGSEKEQFLAKPYAIFRSYGQSKLANLLFCRELAARLRKQDASRIRVNCVHPGEVLTQIMNEMHPLLLLVYAAFRPLAKLLFKSPQEGAVCTTYVATSPDCDCSGQYFMRCRPAEVSEVAKNEEVARRVWEMSLSLTDAPRVI